MNEHRKLRYRFGTDRRLKKKPEFTRVYAGGSRVSDQRLVVYARANQARRSRMGLSVGKKLGSAVRRNRYKRTLREAFRLSRYELPAGYDYLLIPRPTAKPSARLYRESLLRLSRKVAQKCKKHEMNNA